MPRYESISNRAIYSGPSRGLFFGETGCRNSEVNIAGVTIADASIDLSVRLKATATGIADGRRHTVESDSELEPKAGAGGA